MILREGLQKDINIKLPQKIIIDTDGGFQDMLSIIAAQRILERTSSKTEIIGIICTHGKN